MVTEKLYYQDIQTSEFEANIIDVVKQDKHWGVILDKTYFYPEGGGQPADKGWLNGVAVLDVQKNEDMIFHILPENPGTGVAKGKIDMEWRRHFMQQHTGQHIISGALWNVGQYKTVSVHMGLDYTTIEIDAAEISEEDLARVEKISNDTIRDDIRVNTVYTNDEELEKYPLRKATAVKGEVRLVIMDDFDCSACGGIHLESTKDVRLVKSGGIEKIRGHARIAFKIGDRALEDYRKKDGIITALKSVMGTNEDLLVQKSRDIQDELSSMRKKTGVFETRLADTIAARMFDDGEVIDFLGLPDHRLITGSWAEEDDNLSRKIVKNLLGMGKVIFCIVNSVGNKVQWNIGCSEDVQLPFMNFRDKVLGLIEGKGGGRFPLWQGIGMKPEGAGEFVLKFKEIVKEMK